MKLRVRKFKKTYAFTKRRSRVKLKNHPYIIPVSGLIVGFLVVCAVVILSGGQTVGPSDTRVVHLYVDGQERTVATRAENIGDLTKKLELNLIPEDIVEPKADTPIDRDDIKVTVYRARPVTVIDDNGHASTVLTAYTSPKLAAEQVGLKVYPEDKAKFAQGDIQEGIIGQKVVIDRATPVTLNLYGTPLSLRTRAETVDELVKQKNIKLAPGDSMQPVGSTPVTDNLQIFIIRFGTQVITQEEVIQAPLEVINDPNLPVGQNIVREAGSNGRKAVTYQIETQNGKEASRQVIQEVLLDEAVKRIVIKGTLVAVDPYHGDKGAIMAAAGISPSDYSYVDYIISRESGWCSTKWQGTHSCPGYFVELHSTSSGFGYGLCQSTPANKMASAGSDWATNAATQLRWCSSYAKKYGGWSGAYTFWIYNHWW